MKLYKLRFKIDLQFGSSKSADKGIGVKTKGGIGIKNCDIS